MTLTCPTLGEWRGKVLSTPTPCTRRRTTKVARLPVPPCLFMTIPSNPCILFLSPSRISENTLTVSPTLNSGISFFISFCSISLIAFLFNIIISLQTICLKLSLRRTGPTGGYIPPARSPAQGYNPLFLSLRRLIPIRSQKQLKNHRLIL